MSKRLLILGRSGQLAQALADAAPDFGFDAACAGRNLADLALRGEVSRLIEARRPDIVINAAAYTHVDGAEAEPELSRAINADGAGEAAEAAQRAGARFIHVSTDYVFTDNGPHAETDEPFPANRYGASKRAGEIAVMAVSPHAAVVRTAGVFSGRGGDFPSAIWRLAHAGSPVRVVNDQKVTPIYAPDLAQRLLALAGTPEAAGLFHCAGAPGGSWFDVAQTALDHLAEAGGPSLTAEPISSDEFERPAKRPRDSRLHGTRLEEATGLGAPNWRPALAGALKTFHTLTSKGR